MESPWQKADKIRKAQKSEQDMKKLPNTTLQPNSGRGVFRKRDARAFRDWLVERRFTEAGSYTIQKQELKDISVQAVRQPPGCKPALSIDFNGEVWWLVREVDFEALQASADLVIDD